MIRVEKNEILEPLLEGIYHDEDSFIKSYRDIIESGGELYLYEPFGLSISITNIIEDIYTKGLVENIKNNANFISKEDSPDDFDQMDMRLFEEKTQYSFIRYKFKYHKKFVAGIRDKDNKEISLYLYISIAQTNLDYHIISFILTTWDDSEDTQSIRNSHVRLSNRQIINLIDEESNELKKIKKTLIGHEPKLGNLLKINKNTFIGIEIWKMEWRNNQDNPDLSAKEVIIENPFYFYSLLKRDDDVSRRTYKIITDALDRGFTTSQVQMVLFYDKVYLEISLKPLNTRFNANGHDATLFRAWELLGLQNYLLNSIDICNSKQEKAILFEELDKIYDCNKLFKKNRKGELWIKFSIYLQDRIGIQSNYDSAINKYERMPLSKDDVDVSIAEGATSSYGSDLGASTDIPSEKDQLDFFQYAKAFADLIRSSSTDTPLTIGVYGSWGIGKSTLMKQIKKEILGLSGVYAIDFNAWEYDASEEIWPGLVRKILNTMEEELSNSIMGSFSIKLKFPSYREYIFKKLIYMAPLFFILIMFIVFLLKYNFDSTAILKAILATSIISLLTVIINIFNIFRSPLGEWITALFQDGSYGKPIGYMENIRKDLESLQKNPRLNECKYIESCVHDDFWNLTNIQSKDLESVDTGHKIVIFIDDLDRCEPNKAVEMLKAINLLLNFKNFVIFMGIDARIISLAIEKHYENLLGSAGASGHEYLEKMVQIPFRIPQPNRVQVIQFLDKQMNVPRHTSKTGFDESYDESMWEDQSPTKEGETEDLSGTYQEVSEEGIDSTSKADGLPSPTSELEQEKKATELKEKEPIDPFTHDEKQIFQKLVDFLQPNPRYLKRLLNIYRLTRHLAKSTGDTIILNNPEMLIKWLIICSRWPYTAYLMMREFNMLKENPEEGKNILLYLNEKVKNRYKESNKWDADQQLFLKILANTTIIGWREFEALQKYTINLNPGVEIEILSELKIR